MNNFCTRHLDKIGSVGSIIIAFCCIGTPALLAFVSAIGLSFLLNHVILFPLLILFLILTIFGLFYGMKDHGYPGPFIMGIVSSFVILFFIMIYYNKLLAILGVVGLVIATISNFVFQLRKR